MEKRLMLLMTCLMIGIGLVNAQISKVTGHVISDEDGLPQWVPLLISTEIL